MDAIAIVGPTGSGKTELAAMLAEKLKTEIISADSMQFYKGMEIGTAIPPSEIRQKIPHHFVAFIPPDYKMSAGIFQNLARKELNRLQKAGKIPIIVGGSGLYISALIDGLFEGPASSDEIRKQIKEHLATYGPEYLVKKLNEVDPVYASKITSPNDLVRIIRALEVYELTGIPFSEWHKKHHEQAKPLQAVQVAIGWQRNILYERINKRVDEMIKDGWIEEVETLLKNGYEKDIYRLKALGYREIIYFLKGKQSLENTIENIKLYHRRYAKRQMTWFRSDKRVQWFVMDTDKTINDLLAWAIKTIENFSTDSEIKTNSCFLFRHH
ncbi:MAG TPA: tRNA (adenosine(37)-N6)-dimethylallyltransferase MiaA [Candidatus Hydrogenedens sp.]|nr:tRNA (adenosine(37)-N6)-dimethylallyltransferase MiaA [Candidatus Hydrogenedens sp.]